MEMSTNALLTLVGVDDKDVDTFMGAQESWEVKAQKETEKDAEEGTHAPLAPPTLDTKVIKEAEIEKEATTTEDAKVIEHLEPGQTLTQSQSQTQSQTQKKKKKNKNGKKH